MRIDYDDRYLRELAWLVKNFDNPDPVQLTEKQLWSPSLERVIDKWTSYWLGNFAVFKGTKVKQGKGIHKYCRFLTDPEDAGFYFSMMANVLGYDRSLDTQAKDAGEHPRKLKLTFLLANSAKFGVSIGGEDYFPVYNELCTVSSMFLNGIIPYNLYCKGIRNSLELFNPNKLIIGDGSLKHFKKYIDEYIYQADFEGTEIEDLIRGQYEHEAEHFKNIKTGYKKVGLDLKPLCGVRYFSPTGNYNFFIDVSAFDVLMMNGKISEQQYNIFFDTALKPTIEQSGGDDFITDSFMLYQRIRETQLTNMMANL